MPGSGAGGAGTGLAFDAMQSNMQPWHSDGVDLRTIAQEVRDQQEAIEALMDMLEKTITVEVRSGSCLGSCRVARA